MFKQTIHFQTGSVLKTNSKIFLLTRCTNKNYFKNTQRGINFFKFLCSI